MTSIIMSIHVVRKDHAGTSVRVVEDTCIPDYGSAYPATTDCLCWHCAHSFDTRPIPLPVSHDERRNTFKVAGTFCSFACMAAYNREYSRNHTGVGRGMAIYELFKQMTKTSTPVIPVAPPRQFLKCFGGWMDIDTFRAESGEHDYELVPPKCLPLVQVYRKNCVAKQNGGTRSKSVIGKRFSPPQKKMESETLKLRKPAKAAAEPPAGKKRLTILEKTLGLG
jgi:hypothetical protein